jgi:Flp pilus assembly protein TadD
MMQRGQDVDVALSLAEIAHRGMPNSPATADTLAWAYYMKGTYGSAHDLLETAVKDDPDDASIQYHLGMIDSKLGNKADARVHLQKSLSLAPTTETGKSAAQALHSIG